MDGGMDGRAQRPVQGRRRAPGAVSMAAVLALAGLVLVALRLAGGQGGFGEPIRFPVDGLTSYIDAFGVPRLAGTPDAHVNVGVDVFATGGATVRAVGAGVVTATGVDRRRIYGRWFVLQTSPTERFRYAAVSDPPVVGRRVGAGEPIARVALTVRGSRPRLVLERWVRVDGVWQAVNVYQQLRVAEHRPIGRLEVREVRGIVVAADAAAKLEQLLDRAEAAGFVLGGSGYRSPAEVVARRRAACGATDWDVEHKPAEQCRPPTPARARASSRRAARSTSRWFPPWAPRPGRCAAPTWPTSGSPPTPPARAGATTPPPPPGAGPSRRSRPLRTYGGGSCRLRGPLLARRHQPLAQHRGSGRCPMTSDLRIRTFDPSGQPTESAPIQALRLSLAGSACTHNADSSA